MDLKDFDITPMSVIGLWLGYPTCCCHAFGPDKTNGLTYALKGIDVVTDGTGFIPCEVCNATKTREQLIDEINANRICPVPFPKEGMKHVEEFDVFDLEVVTDVLIKRFALASPA